MSTQWVTETKPGAGWNYDSSSITYDGKYDAIENLIVYYDSLGITTSWTTINKP